MSRGRWISSARSETRSAIDTATLERRTSDPTPHVSPVRAHQLRRRRRRTRRRPRRPTATSSCPPRRCAVRLLPDGEEMFIDRGSPLPRRGHRPRASSARSTPSWDEKVAHGREHHRLDDAWPRAFTDAELVEATLRIDAVLTPGMAGPSRVFTLFGPLHDLGEKLDQDKRFDPGRSSSSAVTAALEHSLGPPWPGRCSAGPSFTALRRRGGSSGCGRGTPWGSPSTRPSPGAVVRSHRAVTRRSACGAMRLATAALAWSRRLPHRAWAPFVTAAAAWASPFRRRVSHPATVPLYCKQFRARLRDYRRPDFHPLPARRRRAEGPRGGPEPLDDDEPRATVVPYRA